MEKNEYLLSSFNNVQSLIQFADQKVASILLVDSITIGIFISRVNDFQFSFLQISLWGIISFLSGCIFVISNIIALYKGIIKVLKPSFAKYYNKNDMSLFYFGHIANSSKEVVLSKAKKLTDGKMLEELSAQLFEISKILNRKNKQVSQICVCLFISIIAFLTFLVSCSFL